MCEAELEFYHSMSETKKDCETCGMLDTLKKNPSAFHFNSSIEKSKKVGSIVDKSIKEFKQEVEQEKHKLKNEFYKPDE